VVSHTYWEGRAGVLLPVTWIDGWPVIGKPGPDGIGEMVWGGDRPIPAKSKSELFASDSLRKRSLIPEWEWRYQPRPDAWRFTGRGLRMQALLPLAGKGGFAGVRNVLTQRSARTAKAEVTVKMDLGGLVNGEEAGLAHFSRDNCRLAVVQIGGVRKVVRIDQGNETAGPAVTALGIWLRSTWSEEGMARFSYSLDGSAFTEIGSSCRLSWGSYRGDRIGLYTVNGTIERGYVDFSDFGYRVE